MQVGILGPLVVRDGGGAAIEVTGARLRTLLVRLALDAGRPVPASALVDAIWGDTPPAEAGNALQTLVSRLRRTLGDATLVGQSPAGYRLAIDADDVDATRFEQLSAQGARTLSVDTLDEALALWRGDPDPAIPETTAARLHELHAAARVERAGALIAAGDPAAAVSDVETLAAQRPLDERVAGTLVTALAAAGRQADALRAFERVRAALADELGVDPSAELRDLHVAVLRGEAGPRQVTEDGDARRTNLRAQLTSFVGREEEVARAAKALADNRLVTIVGPGGAGKTRLAAEVGGMLDARDGVWLAELAPITDAADVAQAVLDALGLRERHLLERRGPRSAQDAETRLVDVLADRSPVIVLDNCEHLIDASARLAESLLGQCPGLRVLATSREPLGIIGEVVLAVPPLGQPEPDAPLAVAVEYPAVRLFADRAGAARPDFEVDDSSVATVVEIVRRLDGLPLAIELAAARLRSLPIADIASRLSDRFRLLTGGSRTALPRHRTLRAVVEWSWELLTDEERVLAERLAVFPAGMTQDSATETCADDAIPAADIADLLASLVDKSLLQRVGDAGRMRMLETIREYGVERLADRGELAGIRDRHASYFGRLIYEAQPHLVTSDQLRWFDLLAAERDNVLAALRYRCDTGDGEAALQIAIDLAAWAMMLGNTADLGPWLTEAMSIAGDVDSPRHWVARALLAMLASSANSKVDQQDVSTDRLAEIAQRLKDVSPSMHPMVAVMRPAIAFFAGNIELAEEFVEEALHSDDAWARAAGRMFRANVAENRGDIEGMEVDIEQALAEFRTLGERWGLGNTLGALATLRTITGRLDEAQIAYEEAISLMRELKSVEDESYLLVRMADIAHRRGDLSRAKDLVAQAVDSADSSGTHMLSVFATSMLADMERQSGNREAAHALHTRAMQRLHALPDAHPTQRHAITIVAVVSARLTAEDGDRAAAHRHAKEAYVAGLGTMDLPILAIVGVLVAELAHADGQSESAAEMLGSSARLRGADDDTATEIVRLTTQLRAALGDAEFETSYARGKSLDRDAAAKRIDPAEALA